MPIYKTVVVTKVSERSSVLSTCISPGRRRFSPSLFDTKILVQFFILYISTVIIFFYIKIVRSFWQTPLSSIIGTSTYFGQFDHKPSFLSYPLFSLALYLNQSRLIHLHPLLMFSFVISFSLFRLFPHTLILLHTSPWSPPTFHTIFSRWRNLHLWSNTFHSLHLKFLVPRSHLFSHYMSPFSCGSTLRLNIYSSFASLAHNLIHCEASYCRRQTLEKKKYTTLVHLFVCMQDFPETYFRYHRP